MDESVRVQVTKRAPIHIYCLPYLVSSIVFIVSRHTIGVVLVTYLIVLSLLLRVLLYTIPIVLPRTQVV